MIGSAARWFSVHGWVTAICLVIAGCGEGGAPSPAPVTNNDPAPPVSDQKLHACFARPVVVGLPYFTPDEQGVTDRSGCFAYTRGDPVSFFMGTREGTVIRGNVLGQANLQAGGFVTVRTLSSDANTQNNLEAFLLTANSAADLSSGIILTPSLVEALAQLSQFDFSVPDFSNPLEQLATVARASGDGGAHPVVTALSAKETLDASARCSSVGMYSGSSQGRSAGATADDLNVKTRLVVYPPSGQMLGAMDVSAISQPSVITESSILFGSSLPLSTEAPALQTASPNLTVSGTFNEDSFRGTAQVTTSTGAATLSILTFSEMETEGAVRKFVGGDTDSALQLNLFATTDAAGFGILGSAWGIPGFQGIISGSSNSKGEINIGDPYQEFGLSATPLKGGQLEVNVFAIGTGALYRYLLDPCTQ